MRGSLGSKTTILIVFGFMADGENYLYHNCFDSFEYSERAKELAEGYIKIADQRLKAME